ncbi:hypothetical protein AnigIFM59636_002405 [Aspergillus niger]|nr:hypothetical protein AnigIFM59636_002405 [Aspergillus niger]
MATEEAKKIIADISSQDIDQWLQVKSMTPELQEVINNLPLHVITLTQCLVDFHWLEKYLITRGGRSKPSCIEPPQIDWPDNPIEPVGPCKEAFIAEKRLLEDLERMAALASKCGDSPLQDANETRFLRKEVKHVKDLGDLLQPVSYVLMGVQFLGET